MRLLIIWCLIAASVACLAGAVALGDRGDPLMVPGLLAVGLATGLAYRWAPRR